MAERTIKLVALDMDGTLLNNNLKVSDINKKAIKALLNKGIHVVISTGRDYASCYPVAKELQLDTYLIATNGSEIWTMDEKLFERNHIDSKLAHMLWDYGEEMDVHKWFITTKGVFRKELPGNFSDLICLKAGFATDDKKKLQTIEEKLLQHSEFELTNSEPTNIEVNPVGVSKASALEKVCKQLDISMENVLACGDSLNDRHMIEEAGIGVAMENAQETVKSLADYTTKSNDENGVAHAIEHFILKA